MSKNEPNSNDLCVLCGEFMGSFCKNTNEVTSYTKTTIIDLICTFLSDVTSDSSICQNCFIKLNELDEHQMIVDRMKLEFFNTYNSIQRLYPEVSVKLESVDIAIEEEVPEEDYNESYPCSEDNLEKPKRRKSKKSRKLDPIEGAEIIIDEVEGVIFKCKSCKRTIKRRAQMQQHVLIHRSERDVCCHDCGAMFKTPSCLYSHRKIHKERRKLACDMCGKSFEQKYYLSEHMNAIHLDLKKHTCVVCGISFARKASLIKHGDVHRSNAERKVICEVCGFRSHTKPDMNRHMKTHTGEKNYACEVCDKRFACRYNVSAHVKAVHQGIKPKVDESKLRCEICGKRYPRQKQLRKHLYEIHGRDEYAAEFTDERQSIRLN